MMLSTDHCTGVVRAETFRSEPAVVAAADHMRPDAGQLHNALAVQPADRRTLGVNKCMEIMARF